MRPRSTSWRLFLSVLGSVPPGSEHQRGFASHRRYLPSQLRTNASLRLSPGYPSHQTQPQQAVLGHLCWTCLWKRMRFFPQTCQEQVCTKYAHDTRDTPAAASRQFTTGRSDLFYKSLQRDPEGHRIDGSTRRGHDAGAISLKVRVRERSARWRGGATQCDSPIPGSRLKEPWPLRLLSCSRRSVCALTRLLALLFVIAETRVHMLQTVLAIRQRLGRSSLPFRCVLPPHLLAPLSVARNKGRTTKARARRGTLPLDLTAGSFAAQS